MVSVVDLPQPVGPTTAQNCPGSTIRLTSRRAVKAVPRRRQETLAEPRQLDPGVLDPAPSRAGIGGPPAPATVAAPADRPLATFVK